MSFGPLEIILLIVLVLLVFGAKRLPELGRAAGRGVRELRTGVTTLQERTERRHREADEKDEPPRETR